MDIEAARTELSRALAAAGDSEPRLRAARDVLIGRGIEALGLAINSRLTLDEVIRSALEASPGEARRAFAVLLVHAFGVPGLLPNRGQAAADIQALLERALLNPLRRAGYPFDGTAYERRQALAALHSTIEHHLHPPEPSIPRWLHGLGRTD